MALSIKDAETDRLVRRYAGLHRTSYTGAIKLAIADALKREGHLVEETERERVAREFLSAVKTLQQTYRDLPTLDDRTPDAMLYDEDGIPK